jgi:hypothetical protein
VRAVALFGRRWIVAARGPGSTNIGELCELASHC